MKQRRQPYLAALVAFAIIDSWPLLWLGSATSMHSRALVAAAFVLGGLLGVWVWGWLASRPLAMTPSRRRSEILIVATVALMLLVGGTPLGAQLIFAAALEGFVCGLLFLTVRIRLRLRRAQIADEDDPR